MSEPERSDPGALIAGRYRIGEAIGRGGMATVFRARDEKLERTVAVKVFTAGDAGSDDAARRLREVRLLAGSNHPHLVTLFDAEWPTTATAAPRPGFLVMELVEGESLRRRIDHAGPDPELARRVVRELSGALAYLHGQGIVHRDLKPENILIERSNGSTKLVDFGIAQLVGAERITTDGTVLGTAAYLSPEQVRGLPVGPAADIYALGLVVLECVTGVRAFPGPAVEAAIARVVTDPSIPSGLPEGWRALLAAMTAREPDDRPTADAIVPLASELGVPVMPGADDATIAMTAPDLSAAAFAAGGLAAEDFDPAGPEVATGPTARYLPAADTGVTVAQAAVTVPDGVRVGGPAPHEAPATVRDDETDARHPRRRGGILLGAFAALLLGAAVLAFSLNAGHRDSDADPTPASHPVSTPAPTVTVTTRVPQPAETPAVQRAPVAPTTVPAGGGAAGGTGAAPTATPPTPGAGPAQASTPGVPGAGHGAAHDSGQHKGHGGGKAGG
ncbi:serine/threonine-protein kinase [Gryllotalpicola reticulitermitis]|uniref:non-specific serine/threonine protein kinase n=1 Tax=Gryllotalpicola reticulitermitis TaxID=1184153 RepID=A0ABV8QAZ7_9MICO